jgi:hypothetical protein
MPLRSVDFSFPYLATSTTPIIRKFATTPLPALESEMASNGLDIPEVIAATARCLSICVKVSVTMWPAL